VAVLLFQMLVERPSPKIPDGLSLSLDLPTHRCSQRQSFAFEHELDIFVLRGNQIIDLI
jgi:hypothetical protein